MSVGQPIAKGDIDDRIASFGKQLNLLFFQIQTYAAQLDALSDPTLQGAPYNYTSGEVTSLRNAYRDLDKFRKVYQGLMYVVSGATQNTGVPTANDATHFGYPFNLNVGAMDGLGL